MEILHVTVAAKCKILLIDTRKEMALSQIMGKFKEHLNISL